MIKFDDKVAVVTGAGRGLGRSHAELLASRGAAVVVNDRDAAAAKETVDSITAAGGKAVANSDDVVQGAEDIVKTAIDNFGRLDIVVNNAGINTPTPFGPGAVDIIRKHMEVNFFGTAAVTAAAWPHLLKSGNGRVVNTCSPTVVGWEGQSGYVVSKGAVYAFTRTLAMDAIKDGIRVNAIAPTAYTRMAEEADLPQELKDQLKSTMTTAMVSPMVAYLASDECSVAGEILMTQGGLMQRMSIAMNEGYTNPDVTPEDIQEHIDQIEDDSTAKPLGIVGSDDGTGLLDLFE
ncbi:SDR family NAD(P)-dependent oxidoreductase [Gordonia sp. (in: high G+C Gram-positive bacteria)]|uniref:SDR family NAD(P)-dependent oxidoreductase n=1 Tax=Gordonia sp. (in: high G+C Gram-positive bacteria) TaxID=84139 RepID=UPI0039E48112